MSFSGVKPLNVNLLSPNLLVSPEVESAAVVVVVDDDTAFESSELEGSFSGVFVKANGDFPGLANATPNAKPPEIGPCFSGVLSLAVSFGFSPNENFPEPNATPVCVESGFAALRPPNEKLGVDVAAGVDDGGLNPPNDTVEPLPVPNLKPEDPDEPKVTEMSR